MKMLEGSPLLRRVPDPTAEPAAILAELGVSDALLLEWQDEPRGLFAWMAAASLAGRTVFPARWLAARPHARGGLADGGRLLWIARSDAALRRLFSDAGMDPDQLSGSARPDEPLALLGMPGDVVTHPAADPFELRRRAELWLQKLGVDRVAIVLGAAGPQEPLMALARKRQLPVLRLAEFSEPAMGRGVGGLRLLQPDFQLDGEHRLPDEHYVPALRDLLHRGSLLRERSLFERLPESWRSACEAELRALYGWQLSPLLRRAAALLQSFLPVSGVTLAPPLPRCESVVAYLLGLSDRRPDEASLAVAPERVAELLVGALQAWERRIDVELTQDAWPMLGARLSPWVEAGHLAACDEGSAQAKTRQFCFSGQPLWLRTRLARAKDGLPVVPLTRDDRRALGWFELSLTVVTTPLRATKNPAQLMSFPALRGECEQLPLLLEGSSA